jgi:hypothetical protein
MHCCTSDVSIVPFTIATATFDVSIVIVCCVAAATATAGTVISSDGIHKHCIILDSMRLNDDF